MTSNPVRISIKPSESIPYSWDMTDLLATGESIDAVSIILTRLIPLPELDVTSTTILNAPTVNGNLITVYIEGSLLSENSIYRLDISFMPNIDTTLTVQSFIYCDNASPYPSPGITRMELRQRCGTILNDMILVEATEDSQADDLSTLIDINTITMPLGELKNRIIYFYGGQSENIGAQRVVTENFPSEGRIRWNNDLAVPVVRGDRAELWNHRAQGIRPAQMNDFIKIAHSEASVYNHVRMTIDITSDFSASEPDNTVAIPAGVSKVEGVQYMTADQVWVDIPRASPGGPGYWVEPYTRMLTINRPISTWADGSVVRIMTRSREAPLESDTDTTIINAEWLCARACELACTALVNRNPDQNVYRDKMYKYERIAQSMRTLIVPRTKVGTMLEW